MAMVKTSTEIERMREGGAILSRALKAASEVAQPGVQIRELDAIAEKALRAEGATPSFKGYTSSPHTPIFPSTLCVSVNEEIVHGLGNRRRRLKEGDIVGLDIGCWYKGLCTDMAITIPIGQITQEEQRLLEVTRASLFAGIQKACVGGDVRDISRAIETHIEPYGFGIVQTLTGHGVGHSVHEEPHIPNFFDRKQPKIKIVDGMCLAIEPMVALGDYLVVTGPDGWAVIMKDGSCGAHFEMTIAVTSAGPQILTPLPEI